MPMLKRTPSLVKQVKTHLKQRIRNAEFAEGRLPPEAELAVELGISRNTVRDALSQLEAEGIIVRKQGAGTFVSQAGVLVKTRLQEIVLYEDLIRDHGYTPTIQLVSAEETLVDESITSVLGCPPQEKLLVVKKLFLADNKPVIFSQTHLPPALIQTPYTSDDLRQPIFQFISQICRQTFMYYVTEIVPVLAPAWLAEPLQLPPEKKALVSFEEVGYNQADEPIIKAISYFRDDLLRLRLVRRLTP